HRRLDLARKDPTASRQMFISHALVEGDWRFAPGFVIANRALVETLRSLAQRCRRRELMVGDEELFAYYEARIGSEVTSGPTFERWSRTVSPASITAAPEDLAGPASALVNPPNYPNSWPLSSGGELAIHYKWQPGDAEDGVTVDVPLGLLGGISGDDFEWQVPGLREEVVTALIRSLPKSVRRHLVPVAERARWFTSNFGPRDGPLQHALARSLSGVAGLAVSPQDFDWAKVPAHLRLNFHVVGEGGRVLAAGKDLKELRSRMEPLLARALADAARCCELERSGLTNWDFGPEVGGTERGGSALPRVFEAHWQGCVLTGYPAFVDEGRSVAVRVFTTPRAQIEAMTTGSCRLLLLNLPSFRQRVGRLVLLAERAGVPALPGGPYRSARELAEDAAAAVVDEIVASHGGPAWERDGFETLLEAADAEFDTAARRAMLAAVSLLCRLASVRRQMDALWPRASALPAETPLRRALEDVSEQLERLVGRGFVRGTGAARLGDIERYLAAVERRLDKLPLDPLRDLDFTQRIRALQSRVAKAAGRGSPGLLDEVRWMIEELRVSFFAQSLGTRVPVSEARVGKAIDRALSEA
ncbi:MAG TPA: DUF3418 domain-containing protein, partial [Acidimicrobiales bacterium]|nr:DUF3418 domain-containing protein [Acidimicrobiales bacterium]